MSNTTSLREMLENGETVKVTENENAVPVEGIAVTSTETNSNMETENNTTPTSIIPPGTPTITSPTSANTTTTQRLGFSDRAEEMGLTSIGEGCFKYTDEFCEIAYRNVSTGGGAEIADNFQIPKLVIFTKGLGDEEEWKFVGFISDSYKFVGTGDMVNAIRQSLTEFGSPIINEETFFSSNHSQVRHEMVIQNATDVPNVGSIYPQIVLGNSYDGTKASNVTFGLFFNDGVDNIRIGASKKLGYIRQIHLAGASTTMGAAVGEYINVFTNNIVEMITENFNNHITEDDMLKSLNLIQKLVGKKRRDSLKEILDSNRATQGIESWSLTSWQLFNAIAKFSTIERNLSAKLLIESVAERVLVVPAQMATALAVING